MKAVEAVGLQAIGGAHWVGGVNYVVNLARAIHSLPANERPDIHLVESPDGDIRLYKEIGGIVKIVRWPGRNNPRFLRHFLLRRRGVPILKILGDDLKKRRVAAVFPVKSRKLGKLDVPWIPWVVDFQHKYYPDFFAPDYIAARDELYKWLIEQGRIVVTSSESALEDCDRAFPGYRDRLRILRFRTVTPAEWYTGDPQAVARERGLPPRFLVTPNQFFAHKNHVNLFKAMVLLRDRGRDVHLVCTGKPEDFRDADHVPKLREQVRAAQMDDRIHLVGLLPRHDQIQLIRAASAVVQPSYFEGWSTVVEDARALGKKLFLSDLPVHREQNPPGTTFFDPKDPEALCEAIDARWDGLVPGPVLAEEQEAARVQGQLVQDYAREFLAIVAELQALVGTSAPAVSRAR